MKIEFLKGSCESLDFQNTVYGPLELPIQIQSAPWRRSWAYVLYVLVLLSAVLMVVRVRTGYLRSNTRRLERLVQERTAELNLANQLLADLTITDPLTGLHNRHHLDLVMPQLVQQTLRRRASLAGQERKPAHCDLIFFMIDLDHFKSVNDDYGHHSGDLLMKGTTQAIRECMRKTDIAVRMGGEEFLVVAVDSNQVEACTLAERLRERISRQSYPQSDGRTITRTASVGFAVLPLFPEMPASLRWEKVMDLAGECLYEAKSSGRNRWVGIIPEGTAPIPSGCDPQRLKLCDLLAQGLVQHCDGPSAISS